MPRGQLAGPAVANDAVPDASALIAQALLDATGIPADQFRNVVIVYETLADTVGALSFTCCTEHTLKLLGLAVAVVIDDPVPQLGLDCTG
jgi:hypothetical protein